MPEIFGESPPKGGDGVDRKVRERNKIVEMPAPELLRMLLGITEKNPPIGNATSYAFDTPTGTPLLKPMKGGNSLNSGEILRLLNANPQNANEIEKELALSLKTLGYNTRENLAMKLFPDADNDHGDPGIS